MDRATGASNPARASGPPPSPTNRPSVRLGRCGFVSRQPGYFGEHNLPHAIALAPDVREAEVRGEWLAMVLALEMHLSCQHGTVGPDSLNGILDHERLQLERRIDRLRDKLLLRLHLAATIHEMVVVRQQSFEKCLVSLQLRSVIVSRGRRQI